MQTIVTFLTDGSSYAMAALAAGLGGLATYALLSFFGRLGKPADVTGPAEIEHKFELLDEALNTMNHGLCLFDADHRLVLWNSRFTDMYHVQGKLRVGQSLPEILRLRRDAGMLLANPEKYARKVAVALQEGGTFRDVFELPDGRTISLVNEPSKTGGWVSTHEDITEQKRRDESFRLLFDNNPLPMWVQDRETLRFLAINDAAVSHYGYNREQCMAMSILEFKLPEDRPALHKTITSGEYRSGLAARHVKADGTQIDVSVFARSMRYAGRPADLCAIVDLTDRNRAEAEVRRTRAFLDTIIENVPSNILVKELPSLRYLLVNRSSEKYFELRREQMVGKTTADIFPKAMADRIHADDMQVLESGKETFIDEHPVETPSDGTHIVTTTRIPVRGEDGTPQFMISVIHDVTERKRYEDRIAHMAHHDSLTNLPNRTAFDKHLTETIDNAAAAKRNFAVLFIDLDRFKEVNDVFGHAVGDEMLRQVSARLDRACKGAFLARLGGDEFTAISDMGDQPSDAEALADRMYAALADDIVIQGNTLHAGLTIGVSIYPTDATDAASLIAHADAALYRAKAEARGSIRFFEPDMDRRLREKRTLQQDLRSALVRNELRLDYQPQAQIGGKITGFEALARWHHPGRGLVSPSVFIPLAEESGIILSLGEWILREACREAASWPKPLKIAVNLSPVQFQHGDIAGLVHSALLETGLKPQRLELEITEGVLIGDFSRAVSILRRLKALGVRIAMDDFGTGYSSLSYLQALPFDKIKIDRAFIANLDKSPQSDAIVRAVIGLGRSLNLPVTAEGVETQAQLDFLTFERCQEVQGFFIGRPGPIDNFAELTGRAAVPKIKSLAG